MKKFCIAAAALVLLFSACSNPSDDAAKKEDSTTPPDAGGTGTKLEAPAGLSVTSKTANSITLGWSAVTGATGYRIYLASGGFGPYTAVGDATGTSYTVTGLTAATAYYFKVSTLNGATEGDQTAQYATDSTPAEASASLAGTTWTPLHNQPENPQIGTYTSAVDFVDSAVGSDGTPFVSFRWPQASSGYENPIAYKYNVSMWQGLGHIQGLVVNTDRSHYLRMTASGTTPYVVFREMKSGEVQNKFTVMKLNGSSWEAVGARGQGTGSAEYCDVAVGSDGTVWVAVSAGGMDVQVYKYDGSSWTQSAGANLGSAAIGSISPRIFVAGTQPYLAFKAGDEIKVSTLSGGSWSQIAGSVRGTGEEVDSVQGLAVSGNKVYVMYGFNDSNPGTSARVKVSESGGEWTALGTDAFNIDYATNHRGGDLEIYNGTPYVAYSDGSGGSKAVVKGWSGTAWAAVGNTPITQSNATFVSLSISSTGTAYMACSDSWFAGKPVMYKLQ